MFDFSRYRRVALDTCPIIYYLQEHPRYINLVNNLFSLMARGSITGVISAVSLIEVLVKPIRDQQMDLAVQYRDNLLSAPYLQFYPLEERISEKTAVLRAKYYGNGKKLKVPDAVQLATAVCAEADLFITNDSNFRELTEVEILIIEDCL